ncbi:MAG: YeaH/YhbH family protein [Aquabacterium sp.]|uniref:YeaH/YhbH family protein n=1 Tax=Aquabacterium sp. TaxID=1872578 RepID=UPI0025BDA6DF|nr:YeaH/YhbH family protein [Aquabacterium sp.]MBI3380897.1 YeaH/YhbH family protein [Aquabacterium sp.]
MRQHIIDRRLAGKNKSIGNRERFLRRYKDQVREAVQRAINGRSIRDIEKGEDIAIPKRDLSEPVFGHGQGGTREVVHPGNKEYVKGDRIEKPQGGQGQGSGSGQASDSGEGEDDFVFSLSKEEFMQVFFEDLALPNLVRTALAEVPEWKSHRAGYSSDGTPNNLHVVRSMRGALGRRIALGASSRREIQELEERLAALRAETEDGDDALVHKHAAEIEEIEAKLVHLYGRMKGIPFLDPIDLRFRSRVKVPVPTTKAVMFCVMDVSGSMDEQRKELSKRFFILLYLFLTRHYDKIELVFIRHHTQAQEVTEDEFFHATETGGTVVSSALVLLDEIIQARYPTSEWNLYVAQASDGDNWHHDSSRCREIIEQKILPLVRYYAYVQVAQTEQNLWDEYLALAEQHKQFAMRKVLDASQIYPVFRELFKKEGVDA